MLIEKELILASKEKLGEDAARIIAKDLNLQQWDDENLKALCCFHQEDSPSMIWSHKDNAFKCFGCGRRLGIIDHYMQFYGLTYVGAVKKLFEVTGQKYSFGEHGVKTQRDYVYPVYEKSEDRSAVEKYCKTRKISKETLDYADVQQDKNGNVVFNFYDVNDVLTLVKYRPSRPVTKKENKSWCQVGADTSPILFNMNRIDFTNGALLICEGEFDALSAIESGYKNVVSVPLGANNYGWIETNWEWLELFDRIIVWSDSDEAGLKMRKEACSRLGVWRTLYVDPPTKITLDDGVEKKVKDINEVLFYCGKQKVLDLINEAKELPIEGVKDLASVEDFDIEKAPGLYSGLKPIDDVVYKFLFGNTIVVTGKRGAGKSTLLNQCFICEPLQQNYDVFIFSGEMGAPVLKSWVELTMAGCEKVKMKGEFIHIIDPIAKSQIKEWYTGRTWIYDHPSNKIEDVLEKAISVTRKYGAKVWLLDNLSTIDLGANDNNMLEKQRGLIVEVNRLAKLYDVLVVLVVHPRKLPAGQEIEGDDVAGSGSLGNLAQYMMSVKRFSDKEKAGERDGRGNLKKGKEPFQEDVEVNILKNRFTGRIKAVKLFFNYKSYRFFSNGAELFKRYKWNKDTSPMPKIEDEDERFAMPEAFNE
jgi:twinkle protein